MQKNNDMVQIAGVELIALDDFIDVRGQFTEFFRKEWFPETNWSNLQINSSLSNTNVLRGLHYHFNQVDYWYVPHGTIMVALYDLRKNSPTEGNCWNGFMSENTPMGLYIPEGVAHGFYCVNDANLFYVVNQYYNPDDEHTIHWSSEELEGLFPHANNPEISERDDNAPLIKDLSENQLPEYPIDYRQSIIDSADLIKETFTNFGVDIKE